MKRSLFMALFAIQSVLFSSNSYSLEEKKMVELSMNEFQALMVAYNAPEAQKISLNYYDIHIRDDEGMYIVYFGYNNKPQGLRGAVSGFPEPTFEIEKKTLTIRRVYYGR